MLSLAQFITILASVGAAGKLHLPASAAPPPAPAALLLAREKPDEDRKLFEILHSTDLIHPMALSRRVSS